MKRYGDGMFTIKNVQMLRMNASLLAPFKPSLP